MTATENKANLVEKVLKDIEGYSSESLFITEVSGQYRLLHRIYNTFTKPEYRYICTLTDIEAYILYNQKKADCSRDIPKPRIRVQCQLRKQI